ncbi:AAA family ATPase [Pseudomonas sp. TNT2022 ID357]|uniref:AAA family ATPase n=1 Tax=Pseudomonas idahonensis TaxID=2942628 RepID=A0ABT5Q8H4_9PSED|nr:AAA family ATPase [Pseudomonas idahonensis]MDD1150245.1 AAA family ATPase [Pseudomonas idahonensis]
MISSFQKDGITIPLTRSPALGPDGAPLYAADSMTLLVGPNGSGKTRIMIGLASGLTRKAQTGEHPVRINWESELDHDSTCVVYYTPVPYHLPAPRKSKQYRVIKTSLTTTEMPPSDEHKHIIDLLKIEFGMEARKVLTLPKLSEMDISEIMSQAFSQYRGVTNEWIIPFLERHKELNKRATLPDGTRDWGMEESLRKQRSELTNDFAMVLQNRIGPDFPLRIRAFSHLQSGRSQSISAQNQILESLGFTFKRPTSKSPTVPKKKFDETLIKLKELAWILNDPGVTKSAYYVDDEQSERLKSLQLGKLGQLSLTELSSGAAALIHQFSSIDIACNELLREKPYENLVLLIDEGDAFLHLGWQQKYVDYLDKTAALLKRKFNSVQIILATHSPVLMSDFPRECISILDRKNWLEDLVDGTTTLSPSESFGAPLDAVVRQVGQTGTMGTFAARAIKSVVEEISRGSQVSPERIDMIGDTVIRRQVANTVFEQQLQKPEA